jgi:hypothetical protein
LCGVRLGSKGDIRLATGYVRLVPDLDSFTAANG